MKYQVVMKDLEEPEGYVYPEVFTTIREAQLFVEDLEEELGTEYYDIFICEVGK